MVGDVGLTSGVAAVTLVVPCGRIDVVRTLLPRVALLSFVLLLVGSGPASAHASLVRSDPKDGPEHKDFTRRHRAHVSLGFLVGAVAITLLLAPLRRPRA